MAKFDDLLKRASKKGSTLPLPHVSKRGYGIKETMKSLKDLNAGKTSDGSGPPNGKPTDLGAEARLNETAASNASKPLQESAEPVPTSDMPFCEIGHLNASIQSNQDPASYKSAINTQSIRNQAPDLKSDQSEVLSLESAISPQSFSQVDNSGDGSGADDSVISPQSDSFSIISSNERIQVIRNQSDINSNEIEALERHSSQSIRNHQSGEPPEVGTKSAISPKAIRNQELEIQANAEVGDSSESVINAESNIIDSVKSKKSRKNDSVISPQSIRNQNETEGSSNEKTTAAQSPQSDRNQSVTYPQSTRNQSAIKAEEIRNHSVISPQSSPASIPQSNPRSKYFTENGEFLSHSLSELEERIVAFLFRLCSQNPKRETGRVWYEQIAEAVGTTKNTAKNTCFRLLTGQVLIKVSSTFGPKASVCLKFPDPIYAKVFDHLTTFDFGRSMGDLHLQLRSQSAIKAQSSAPSNAQQVPPSKLVSDLNITNSLTSEPESSGIEVADLSPVRGFGITRKHLQDIKNQKLKVTLTQLEDFIARFGEYASDPKSLKNVRSVPALFIRMVQRLAAGDDPLGAIQTNEDRLLEELLAQKRERLEKLRKQNEELFELDFEEWLLSLTEDTKKALLPANSLVREGGAGQRALLKEKFRSEVWQPRSETHGN